MISVIPPDLGTTDNRHMETISGPRVPLNPPHPERTCWGCDKYCPADSLACGNGTIRTLHPVELFGQDWLAWSERPGRALPG